MATKRTTAVEAKLKRYEIIFIFQPELLESAVEKKLKEFDKFLEESGAHIEMRDNWGKRKLAYPIGKHDQGIYVAYNAKLLTSFNRELDEHFRIDKDVIRHMVVSIEDDYTYQKFAEEVLPKSNAPRPGHMEEKTSHSKSDTTHKADTGEKKSEVKDKGKKADAGSLDDKLDKILEGEDINV